MRTEHGVVPVPTPVVVELLHGVPTYSRGVPTELVTATGAAILAALSEGFGDMPMMRADHVGYGAGHLRMELPNAVRVVIGEEQRTGLRAAPAVSLEELAATADAVVTGVLEAAKRRDVTAVLDRLIEAGARRAWSGTAMGACHPRRGPQRAPVRARDRVIRGVTAGGTTAGMEGLVARTLGG